MKKYPNVIKFHIRAVYLLIPKTDLLDLKKLNCCGIYDILNGRRPLAV